MNTREPTQLRYPEDYLQIIDNGIEEKSTPKRIIIIGAGLAGLVAGHLLKDAGHDVVILEANKRIGGRVYTIREPLTKGNYLDVGAMRIPNYHRLVHAYIKKFALKLHPFINETPEDIILVNNIRTTREAYEANPDILNFPLPDHEKGKTADQLLQEAIDPFVELYTNSNEQGQRLLEEKYKGYSIGEFLQNNPLGPSLSPNAIRLIGIISGLEGFPQGSFVDVITDILEPLTVDNVHFDAINNGNDRLPYSISKQLEKNIKTEQRVIAIRQSSSHITVQTDKKQTYKGDFVINTSPFSVFQFIDVTPYESISFEKWQIIRQLLHIPSVKIGIEFKERFWEGLNMGNAISDLPSRFSYIPSYGKGMKGPAVLLASYSWGEDALLWTSTTPTLMIQMILRDLAQIYGNIVYKQFSRSVYFNWSLNPYSAGCFTLLTPLIGAAITEDIIKQPEGRIHFAGDHTSNFNGWIEGAIQSGIRAAMEVNQQE